MPSDASPEWLQPNRAGTARGRQANAGRRASSDSLNFSRGRYIRASTKPAPGRKIALEATLRAAAPLQIERRRARPGSGNREIHLTPADLRFKQFRQKTGMLIIFGVDASGSMALNRLNQAKGAALQLLGNAYVDRDRVALISFRGRGAEVLLRPTRSVELAKRAVAALPGGGGTPLAAGLEAALELARGERAACGRTLLVLLTDGRANVARAGEQPDERQRKTIWEDVELACSALHDAGVAAVVIDAASRLTSSGDAERLAALLGGKYVSLPSGNAEAVCEEVRRCSAGMRAGETPAWKIV
jgi:magnesium chelatase subunit D